MKRVERSALGVERPRVHAIRTRGDGKDASRDAAALVFTLNAQRSMLDLESVAPHCRSHP
jgi:hypothetical protein